MEHCLSITDTNVDPDKDKGTLPSSLHRHLEWENADGSTMPEHSAPEKWIATQWVHSRRPALSDGVLYACVDKMERDDKQKMHLYGYLAGQYTHRTFEDIDWKRRMWTWDVYALASIYLLLWNRFLKAHCPLSTSSATTTTAIASLPEWCNECSRHLHTFCSREWENRPENAMLARDMWNAFLQQRTLEDWIAWEKVQWQ